MHKKFIDLVLDVVSKKNNGGFIEFTFTPEFENTDLSVKIITGMTVLQNPQFSKDNNKARTFNVILRVVEFFHNENEEQKSEEVNITVSYKTILNAINDYMYTKTINQTVNTYTELSIVELLLRLQTDEIIGLNLGRFKTQQEPKIY